MSGANIEWALAEAERATEPKERLAALETVAYLVDLLFENSHVAEAGADTIGRLRRIDRCGATVCDWTRLRPSDSPLEPLRRCFVRVRNFLSQHDAACVAR